MKPNIGSVGIYCRRLLRPPAYRRQAMNEALPFPNILEGIAHHLDKDLFA